jgi:hypothetical protein
LIDTVLPLWAHHVPNSVANSPMPAASHGQRSEVQNGVSAIPARSYRYAVDLLC